ncbi:hypothetical protein QQ045_014862 [Rhodiola kirilowii]
MAAPSSSSPILAVVPASSEDTTVLKSTKKRGPIKTAEEEDEAKNMDTHPVVRECRFERRFLRENHLMKVLEILTLQGWTSLFQGGVEVSNSAMREFYTKFKMTDEEYALVGHYEYGGKAYRFSSVELSYWMKVVHEGYDTYAMGHWPQIVRPQEIIQTITQDEDAPDSNWTTVGMGLAGKVMHNYIISNITPRAQKRNSMFIQGFLLLDKLLAMERINQPWVIIQHMAHIPALSTHGLSYPSIVKLMLQNHHLCEDSEEDTEYIRDLDEGNLRRMQFEKGEDGRWMKKATPPTIARAVDVPSDSDAIPDPSQESVMRELQQMKEMLQTKMFQLLKLQAIVAEIHDSAVQAPPPSRNSFI